MRKFLVKISLLIILLTVFLFISYKENNVQAQSSSNSSDIQLLARAINGEARGEPYEGQVAVGAVILNRVKHSSFPNTISGVIYQSRGVYSCGRWTDKCTY